jgi:hypothetical protein
MRIPRQLAEARIATAERLGAFENLRGAGKPLPDDPAPEAHVMELDAVATTGGVPEEAVLLREIEVLRAKLAEANEQDAATIRRAIALREMHLAILHEQGGRFLTAMRLGR